MQKYNDRFKDAPWYKECTKENIMIAGLGGIGSSTLYCIGKTIPCNYYLIDADTIDDYNVGTQFFNKQQVGQLKISACESMLKNFTTANCITFSRKIDDNDYCPITISAFDNMAARKQLFNNWKSRDNRELYVEGRLRASLYEVYVVVKGRERDYELTLFDDNQVADDMCTFKQTAYFAMLIGARITQVVVNYLTNKYTGTDICNLPFTIKELGEPFLIKVKDYDN
jgi:hypothetical protein